MRLFCLLCLLGLLLGYGSGAGAETRYVTDQLVLTMRSTPDQNGEVVSHPQTDDPLEILGEEGNYAHVRDADGLEGYVLKQYLSTATPKPVQIGRLEKQLSQLKEKLTNEVSGSQDQVQELQELRTTNQQLKEDLENNQQELAQLKTTYDRLLADSKNLSEIVSERDRLKQANQSLEAEAKKLREENKSLLVAAMIKWFLAGAGVLLFGWIIGKASRKRQRPF